MAEPIRLVTHRYPPQSPRSRRAELLVLCARIGFTPPPEA